MYQLKSLEGINIEVIHRAFLEAFSDYQVKIDLPLWKLQNMMMRRGYIPEKSMGAFEDEALVGFIINGYREWEGKPTVYDAGTGVVPEHRKQGLTTNMFLKLVGQLKSEGVRQYLLEVIQKNTSAYELYKKQGFEVTRTFSCFQLDKSKYKCEKNFTVEHVECFEPVVWEKIETFWDFKPSWQNSIASVCAAADTFAYSTVHMDNSIVGYGIVEKRTGDIPQLAVHKDYRKKGIGAAILADLIKNTESGRVAFINVDDSADSMKGFLNTSGFEHYVDQYEMILEFND